MLCKHRDLSTVFVICNIYFGNFEFEVFHNIITMVVGCPRGHFMLETNLTIALTLWSLL